MAFITHRMSGTGRNAIINNKGYRRDRMVSLLLSYLFLSYILLGFRVVSPSKPGQVICILIITPPIILSGGSWRTGNEFNGVNIHQIGTTWI